MAKEKSSAALKENQNQSVDKICAVLRILILVNIAALFFPGLNPARITGYIGKNISVFTCGVSYKAMTQSMGRAINQGWIDNVTTILLMISSILMIASAILGGIYICMSMGNLKLKRKGLSMAVIGALVELIACGGFFIAYLQIRVTARPDKVDPQAPPFLILYLLFAALIAVMAITKIKQIPDTYKKMKYEMESKYKLFLMFLPIVILAFMFGYLPLFGWRYAFFDYKAGEQLGADNFVGFKWFTQLFQNSATRSDIARVLKNTLAMSGLGIITSWIPMAFAIFLAEIKNLKVRRFIQTFTTIPNFISWVLVYAIALSIFSTDGFINTFLSSVTGQAQSVNYLMSNSHMWLKMLAWGLWKGLGWSAIIYIAAISGIDQQLYEAATVDGAGRFQKMWYVTVPGLMPTFFVLLLMSIANVLSNGMEQYLVFSNAMNKSSIEVLDLYVYKLGIGSGAIPLSTVIGMVKSLISVILLFTANTFSKKVRGESIV